MPEAGPFVVDGVLWSVDAKGKMFQAEISRPDEKMELSDGAVLAMREGRQSRVAMMQVRAEAVAKNKLSAEEEIKSIEELLAAAGKSL